MSSVVEEWRSARATADRLSKQAKQGLIDRACELARQWYETQEELKRDFGVTTKFPPRGKTKKTPGRKKSSRVTAAAVPTVGTDPPSLKVVTPSKPVKALQRKLNKTQKALDKAVVDGIPGRVAELERRLRDDRECLNDELRLMKEAG